MEKSQNIKMVVHDWDDCAVKTFATVYPTINKFAKSLSLDTPCDQQRLDVWGLPLGTQFAVFWPKENAQNLEKLYVDEVKDLLIPPFPGVVETVKMLKKMGLSLGVLSSGPKLVLLNSFRKFFDDLSEDTYDFMFAREDLAVHKPDPQVFNPIFNHLKKLGMGRENMIYMGDSLFDFQVSRECGITFVATTTGINSRKQFLGAGLEKEFILESFNQLPDWFEKNKF